MMSRYICPPNPDVSFGVFQGGAGYENQLDRGQSSGESVFEVMLGFGIYLGTEDNVHRLW